MRYILSALMLICVSAVSAQDTTLLDKFLSDVSNSCVTLDYTYTARVSGIDNRGYGNLVSQDQMWTMKGNGVEMYCDGEAVWVVDPAAKEVIIESVSDEQEMQFMANPARILFSIGDSFTVNSVNKSSDSKAQVFSLVPKLQSSSANGIEYLNVELFNDSASLRNITFALGDGTLVTIKVSSMKLTPKSSVLMFKPQTVFDSKWIVTDLI